jgi:L-ascorbate metabolism protein UlaG (beta-lactamase superfamily)
MKLQLIRNATLRMNYAQQRFIIDPYLAAKHSLPSYTGASPNPLVELPLPPEEVIAGIKLALISHLHSDHFDPAAQALLPKDILIFCQPGDDSQIREKGFNQVTPIENAINWRGITITRTPGQHGTGDVLQDMGQVSGFVFQAKNEPTVYWAGDTIWYKEVERTIEEVQPDIIITHSSGAKWGDGVLIVMDAAQTIAVCRAAPDSIVIATHMEALDHGTVSRADLSASAEAAGIPGQRLLIPDDGEELAF